MNRVSSKQIAEWAEGPVNTYIIKLIEKYCLYLDEQRGINAYCPGEPQKTQEVLAKLSGEYAAWGDIIELLQGKLSLFIVMEDEDDSSEVEDESE